MRRAPAVFLLLFMFLAMRAVADEAGAVAMLVLDSDEPKIDAALRPALTDADPLVRATAARVANVRIRTPLLDVLRTQLDRESDLTAAREESRAVVMLGGAGEIDRALAASDRFGKKLDAAVAVAVARLGADVAVPVYFDKLRTRAAIGSFFALVLWGHPELRNALAQRLVAANDARGFQWVVGGDIDSGVLIAALRGSPDLRDAAARHILIAKGTIDDPLRAAIRELPRQEGIEDELLHRAAGAPPHSLVDLLRSEDARDLARWYPSDLLTPEEKKMLETGRQVVIKSGRPGQDVTQRKFRLPSALPQGLGAALLRASRCRGTWIGVADVAVDSAGRVITTDMSQFAAAPECLTAANALLRLSLAESPEAGGPRREPVLMVHAAKPDLCLDEEAESSEIPAVRVGTRVRSNVVKPPVALHRVNPVYPEVARSLGEVGIVVIESRISRRGCVSDEQILRQTTSGALNAAALFALDAWTFKPGMLNGEPVDVIFNLTVNFKIP